MTLRDLGLCPEHERLYRLLLALNSATVERLADAIGWELEVTSGAVDELTGLGLARVRSGMVTVLEPSSAVGSLIERVEDDLLARYRRVSATRSELTELVASHVANRGGVPDPNASVERITDLAVLGDKIEELAFFIRTSLSNVQPGGPTLPNAMESSRPLDDRALRRGITMRIVREMDALSTDASRLHLLDLVARGAQVRIGGPEMNRMMLMDDKVAIVPVNDLVPSSGALIIRQPVLVAGFCDLFERTWEQSIDLLDVESGPEQPRVSDQDRAILQMLMAGVTDEVAARELSISVRHLRRHVSRLLAELDAASRFAAGAEAVRRGWI